MQFIAGIPGILAAIVALSKGVPAAFLNVYLPVLFLLPDYYRWVLPALPDPTFNEAAILPIAGLFLWQFRRKWRFSLMDLLVLAFACAMGYSEFLNSGFADAQNLMFDQIAAFVFPYMLAKGLIEPNGLRVAFARRLVILLFAVSLVSVYEFRFGMTPWQLIFGRFFPGQGEGWVTTFRWGFARVAGPYGHSILAGLILIVGYRIQRWLEWSNLWEPRFRKLQNLNISKARLVTLGLLGGVIMTMVRGPWIGGIVGAGVTAIGRARNPKRALLFVAGILVVVGLPALAAFYSYASVGRANAKSVAQETAAYRKELIDKYVAIALEKSVWGWGTNGWPKVDGMPSIDNYYLLLALMHGLVALGLLLAMILVNLVRLLLHGIRYPSLGPPGSNLAFTLAGTYVVVLITIATVFMGTQVMPLFAVLTGWSEGYLLAARETSPAYGASHELHLATEFSFGRVVA